MEENVSPHEESHTRSDDAMEYMSDASMMPDEAETSELHDEPIVIEREERITMDPEAEVIIREEHTVISGLDVGDKADEAIGNIKQGVGDLVGDERLEAEGRASDELHGDLGKKNTPRGATDELHGNPGKKDEP